MKKNVAGIASYLAISLLLLRCAGQISPSGGPPDTVPPVIVRTVPDTNAVHVTGNSFLLEFSKYVDRRSLEESIFISPYPGELEYDWSGTEVKVTLSQPMRKNITYVVNVGTDVIDLHARNRMASGFTLAFSTGDSIDRGFINGRVFDEKPEGVMIFAYQLQGLDPDTLNPSRAKPDYIMQTGRGGMFTLSNIAFGTYRVFAIRDEYRNLLYDKEIDQYGVTTGDITLSPEKPRASNVWFRLSKEDTTRPFITNVRALDRRRILVRFSEPLDTLSFERSVFSLHDTLSQKSLPLAVHYLNRATPSLAGLFTEVPLDSNRVYRLFVSGVADVAGNAIDSLHAWYVFDGTNRPDTVRPGLNVRGLTDSAKGYPLDQPVEIDFSVPVIHARLAHAMNLVDSTKKLVPAELRWLNATDAVLIPLRRLLSKNWYRVTVIMDSASDLQGLTYKDSTYQLRFQTLDLRSTGSIEGMVVDEAGDQASGTIFLKASSIDMTPPTGQTLNIERPGKFVFEHLVEGKYVVSGFRDSDGSGSFGYGSPYPFHPSEHFAVYPDTIKVRARWGVEGLVIKFK